MVRVELEWMKFSNWKEVLDNEEVKYEFPCVYVIADSDMEPLYISKTSQERRDKNGRMYAGGLRARYYHDWTVLDACMEGSGRSVFIAKVAKGQALKIENQLIYENRSKYNTNQKKNVQYVLLSLVHKGVSPNFKNSINR
jgi:hypothetical protein